MANNIEIQGLEDIQRAINNLPESVRPAVLRKIAARPAARAVIEARRLQPIGDTGETARRIGQLRVKFNNQTYVEVGYRGGLGNIYTSGETIARRNRGILKGFPRIFKTAGEKVKSVSISEMKVDVTKTLVAGMRKYLKSR